MNKIKKCAACGEVKCLDDFNRCSSAKDGRQNRCRLCQKSYRAKNKDKTKAWRRRNSKRLTDYSTSYYRKNKESIRAYKRKHFRENRNLYKASNERNREAENKRRREKYKKDPLYNFSCRVRSLLTKSFYYTGEPKENKTFEILGFSAKSLTAHLSRFLNEPCGDCEKVKISFENKNFHIDHIKPIHLAENKLDIVQLNQFKNLRLICESCNLKKGGSYDV